MNHLSKFFTSLVAVAALSSTACAQSDEFKFLPIFNDDNWEPKIEVALIAGYIDFDRSEVDDGHSYGVELSFDCPVFTLPGDNVIRQVLSLNTYNENGLKMTSIEMNPYYMVNISKDLVLGFGPGIGGVKADPDHASSQWMFAVQAGAGIKYYINDFILGADIRHQWTAEKDLGNGSKEDLENTRFLVKAGYRF